MTDTDQLTELALADLVAADLPPVPDDLAFTTGGKTRNVAENVLPITIDGERYNFQMPKGILLTDTLSLIKGKMSEERIATFFPQLLEALLDYEDRSRLLARMDDPTDMLDWPDIIRIIGQCMGRWQVTMGRIWKAAALPAPPVDK